MEVAGNVDTENRNIQVNNQGKGLHQEWDIIYADEWKGEPGKGELNEEFGLYVERPFFVITEMGSKRYLDLINTRNFALKTPNGRNTQVWYFDQKSLTIKSKPHKQSWDIKSSGKSNEMQIWSTNSRWYQLFKYTGDKTRTFVNFQYNQRVLHATKDAEGEAIRV